MKVCVLILKEKTIQHWCSYFQIACKYFYNWPVEYYCWRFLWM